MFLFLPLFERSPDARADPPKIVVWAKKKVRPAFNSHGATTMVDNICCYFVCCTLDRVLLYM